MEFSGTTRIKNPKTLRRWIKSGKYQEYIKKGLVFNPACGRFREDKCECSTCINKKGAKLLRVLEEFELNN